MLHPLMLLTASMSNVCTTLRDTKVGTYNFLPQRPAEIATIVGGASLFLSEGISLNSRSSLVSSAEARVGRPLTPMSYAGVARRTTRRAVAYGAAAGVTVGAAAYAAPGCVQTQVADVYGRIVTVCR
jgi:hypothetical protein